MVIKLVLTLMGVVLALFTISLTQSPLSLVEEIFAKEEIGREVVTIPQIKKIESPFETLESEVKNSFEAESLPTQVVTPEFLYTPDMKVFFEEMTFVQLLSEEYARVETVCAGNGLNNITSLPDGPMILIPNAGDLSVDGSNVAVKLNPDGEITFIPRVQGQRIRVPMDVGDKLTGWEVESLTLNEAMQLMAADRLVWTARWFGPYGNGHGLPGHIAECDPRYPGS